MSENLWYLKLNKNFKKMYDIIDIRVRRVLSTISPTLVSKIIYKRKTGYNLNLKKPQSFNEKIMWLKLNYYNNYDAVTQCADKYRVRDFVKQRGCGEILNNLIAVWDSVDEINWSELPNKFALKCNHGCGYNLICTNKEELNIAKTKSILNRWMREDYWKIGAELNYKYIEKKIICESYIETDQGYFPKDYRFYCINGEPKLLYVSQYELGSNDLDKIFLDLNWNIINVHGDDLNDIDIPEKPSCYNDMLHYAKILSAGFPFVRVDLYDFKGSVLFGELTFTPTAGSSPLNDSPLLEELLTLDISELND